ncbi:MAG: pilus assembly protein PilM [Candidatus Nomurabacteria bacterium]
MFGKNTNQNEVIESYTGIDIGSYAIKVLQIRHDSDQLHLETYGELEMAAYDSLPPGSVSNIGEEKMVKAIKDLLLASKVTANKIIFSIPMQDCFISSITVPKVSDKELVGIVPMEARKYLPVPVSSVKLNYWRSDSSNDPNSTEDIIILAAVKNETFDLYNRYAQKLGLQNFSFEIESMSAARMILRQIKTNDSILHIDIGGKASFVTLIQNRIVKAVSLIQKGSYDNTSQISKVLGIGIDVAEEAKRIFGYLGDSSSPHLEEVMGLASYPLFDEIKHLLFQHERKYNININKIVLSGGGALQKGVQKLLGEFLEREILLADPFSDFILPNNLRDVLKKEDEKYTIAAGLAMKNLFS